MMMMVVSWPFAIALDSLIATAAAAAIVTLKWTFIASIACWWWAAGGTGCVGFIWWDWWWFCCSAPAAATASSTSTNALLLFWTIFVVGIFLWMKLPESFCFLNIRLLLLLRKRLPTYTQALWDHSVVHVWRYFAYLTAFNLWPNLLAKKKNNNKALFKNVK